MISKICHLYIIKLDSNVEFKALVCCYTSDPTYQASYTFKFFKISRLDRKCSDAKLCFFTKKLLSLSKLFWSIFCSNIIRKLFTAELFTVLKLWKKSLNARSGLWSEWFWRVVQALIVRIFSSWFIVRRWDVQLAYWIRHKIYRIYYHH